MKKPSFETQTPAGELHLATLLSSMQPELGAEELVFCSIVPPRADHPTGPNHKGPDHHDGNSTVPAPGSGATPNVALNAVSNLLASLQCVPQAVICEAEGITLILRRADADRNRLSYDYVARQITLTVHSSLSAVGFIAAIATHLAQYGISVNPVSGYYHDHLYVPASRADEALRHLQELSQRYREASL